MSHQYTRFAMALAGVVLMSSRVAVAQAIAPPPVPVPPAPVSVARPVLIGPPAPIIPPRRGALRASSATQAAVVAPMAPPRGSPRPDSVVRRVESIALNAPAPLAVPAPVRRVRDFGSVRNDVAQQPAPAGATGRCKDGTFLTVPPSEEACAGKGGLSVRTPRAPGAPPAPTRRP